MGSFALNYRAHYLKSLDVFRAKTGQNMKNEEMLQKHLPPLIQRMLPDCEQMNILSAGSGEGERDIAILKIIKDELLKGDLGRQMRLFNRAIEPSEHMCDLYKAAIDKLPSSLDDHKTEFEICQQTFQEYQESQREPFKFDIVHFIHSMYYVDIEQTLLHCFHKEMRDTGHFLCILAGRDLMYHVFKKQGKRDARRGFETAEKLFQVATENGWKHELHTAETSIDVTDVFDPQSTEGNLLLDFLTLTPNFPDTADKRLVEETLDMIRELTIVKNGRRLGEKKEDLVIIHRG